VVDGEFCYRKTFRQGAKKAVIDCREFPYVTKPAYADAANVGELLARDLDPVRVQEALGTDPAKRLTAGWQGELLDLVADFDLDAEPQWVIGDNENARPATTIIPESAAV
jgi:hypothetical protein